MHLQHARIRIADAIGEIIDQESPDDNPDRAIDTNRHGKEKLHHAHTQHNAREYEWYSAQLINHTRAGKLAHAQPRSNGRDHHNNGRRDNGHHQRIAEQRQIAIRFKNAEVMFEAEQLESRCAYRLVKRQQRSPDEDQHRQYEQAEKVQHQHCAAQKTEFAKRNFIGPEILARDRRKSLGIAREAAIIPEQHSYNAQEQCRQSAGRAHIRRHRPVHHFVNIGRQHMHTTRQPHQCGHFESFHRADEDQHSERQDRR